MMKNFLKPGDRVQRTDGGPIMIVQGYAKKYNVFMGWHEDRNTVVCSWYDLNKGYQKRQFLQCRLFLVRQTYNLNNKYLGDNQSSHQQIQ